MRDLQKLAEESGRLADALEIQLNNLRVWRKENDNVSPQAVQQSGSVKVNSDYIASNSSEIAPESTNQVQEQQDIVTFSDDKAVLPESMPLEKPLSGPENAQHTDWANHSIISFMQRPQLLGEYNWVKTVARGYIVDGLDFNIPNKLLTTMLLNKLDGFTSFRATAVIKLQINSQPFQQGRLMLAAIPMPELIAPRDEFLTKHPTYLQAINHIQVDISKQTEISLRIPFVSPFNSFDLISNQYQWARVVAVVYSQLRDPRDGGGNVPIRVWGHFEDIQLGTPTSGVFNSQKHATQQSGKVKEPSAAAAKVAQVTESTGNIGMVSALGGGIQNVYKTIGDNVSFLKPVTNILSSLSSFGTNAVSSVLGFLGLCKPQVGYAGATVMVRPCEFYGNANGVDHSHVLALDRMNNVDMYPGLGGTACDEMSFDFLKKIPQFVDYFTYSTTSKSSDVLFNSWVTPTYFAPGYLRIITPKTDTGDAATCQNTQTELKELQPTVLNYISSSFMYWTGSLVYTFRFVKTDFHSGRVEISFHPFTNYRDANKTRIDYTYRLVVDLRENTEVSVSVPYVSPQPWKTIRAKSPMQPVDTDAGWSDYGPCSTGKLIVKPITPLVLSAAVVETEIECVVEVRAGDDFRVQGPCRAGYFPFSVERGSRPLQQRRFRRPSIRDPGNRARQQSGPFAVAGTSETRSAAVEGLIPDSITQGMLDIHRVDTRMLCSGEIFENFRQLIKRFNFVEKFPNFKFKQEVISRATPYYLRSPNLTFAKFYHNQDQPPVVTAAGKFNQYKFDMNITPLSFVSAMYAFYRGGMRFKVYTPDKDVNLVAGRVVDITDVPNLENVFPNFKLPSYRRFASIMSPTAYELIQKKGFAEFQIPFYSPVYVCIPWDKLRISTFDQSSALIDISFSSDSSTKEDIPVYVSVAAADDMTFHGFIGIPPVISAGRINTTHGMKETQNPDAIAPESVVSFIDTTAMAVDPAYPITYNTASGNFWQGSTAEANLPVYIGDLLACPSKTLIDPCDSPPGQNCVPPYDGRCWDRPPGTRPAPTDCTTSSSTGTNNTPSYSSSQIGENSRWGKLNGLLH